MTKIQELERTVGKNQSIVVDSAMELTNVVDWSRAVTLVLTDEAYTLMPRSDGSLIRGASLSIPKPLVICLNRYVPKMMRSYDMNDNVSKKTILNRDSYTCQYCGDYGNTIDHIYPKSKGGRNTWGNLCVACSDCNGRKADRTPEEAGMRAPIIPAVYAPKRSNMIQNTIYEALTQMVEV